MRTERSRGPGPQPVPGSIETINSGNHQSAGTTQGHPSTPTANHRQVMRDLLRIAVIVGTLIASLILLAAISPGTAL